jgi:hypothetical protein
MRCPSSPWMTDTRHAETHSATCGSLALLASSVNAHQWPKTVSSSQTKLRSHPAPHASGQSSYVCCPERCLMALLRLPKLPRSVRGLSDYDSRRLSRHRDSASRLGGVRALMKNTGANIGVHCLRKAGHHERSSPWADPHPARISVRKAHQAAVAAAVQDTNERTLILSFRSNCGRKPGSGSLKWETRCCDEPASRGGPSQITGTGKARNTSELVARTGVEPVIFTLRG